MTTLQIASGFGRGKRSEGGTSKFHNLIFDKGLNGKSRVVFSGAFLQISIAIQIG
jgi:hypothetical protein